MAYYSESSAAAKEQSSHKSELIGSQISELAAILEGIEKQALHLCGSHSADTGGSTLAPVPNGLLNEWNDRLAGLIAQARSIQSTFSSATGY